MQLVSRLVGWLPWITRKLWIHDPGYLLRRLTYGFRRRLIDLAFPAGWFQTEARLVDAALVASSVRVHFKTRRRPVWHHDGESFPALVRRIPPWLKQRTVSEATAIASRRFTFRGHSPIVLDPIVWDREPDGDVAWVQDLNRHNWFATLGFAYWYTGDSRYLRAFVELSDSWIAAYGNRIGEARWDNPFNVAARINAWVWALFLFLPCSEWGERQLRRFLTVLGRLAAYLYQTIEVHSPGNHLLLEAKALALVGELFPEFRGARRWRRKGWDTLDRELRKQICADGVHAQRSTMYHRIIAGELSELWLLAERNGWRHADPLRSIVVHMGEFEQWIDLGRGDYPLFGDSYVEDTYFRFSAAAAVGRLAPAAAPRVLKDYHFWTHGHPVPSSEAEPTPSDRRPAARAFRDGGYYVVRSGWTPDADVLVWDCGPTGYGPHRKHSHLDALSVVLSLGGVPMLIDPGSSQSRTEKRRLRGTGSHNTVVVDGQDQGILSRRNEIWMPPRTALELWAACDRCSVMVGVHDGYTRFPQPVEHSRTIAAVHDGYWVIIDRLSGSGHHDAEQRFHFAPGSRIRVGDDGRSCLTETGSARLRVVCPPVPVAEPSAVECAIEHTVAELACGVSEPVSVLVQRRSGPAPALLVAVLADDRRRVNARVLAADEAGGTVLLEVTGSGFRDVLSVGHDPESEITVGLWKVRSRVAIFRYDADGTTLEGITAAGGDVVREEKFGPGRLKPPRADARGGRGGQCWSLEDPFVAQATVRERRADR